MRKVRQSGVERLENYLVKLIQEKGADADHSGSIRILLACLKGFSCLYAAAVGLRYFLYRLGLIRRSPLGVQVISIGNVTAGGTGKTPVTEIFARTLAAEGRKVAILSRGYRRKRLRGGSVFSPRLSNRRLSCRMENGCFLIRPWAETSRICWRRIFQGFL